MKKIGLMAVAVLFSGWLTAQEKNDMVTDRPDQTESASIIFKNGFQIESGFIYERYDSNFDVISYNSTLLRYGLLEKLELRLGLGYSGVKFYDESESGFAPVSVGAKYKLRDEEDGIPKLAVLTTFTIPNTGSSKFDNKYLGVDLRVNGEYSLNETMSLGANVGVAWSGSEYANYATGIYTAVMGMSLSDKLSAFAELYGFLPEEGKNDHRFDAGLTYAVNDDFQLDCSTGLGLSKVSPDFFISLGLSIRMP